MNDANLILSNHQAITGTTVSENVIKLDATKDAAIGTPVYVLAQVTEDFNNCTSVTVALETADNESFTNAVTLVSSGAEVLAKLKAGFKFNPLTLPKGNLGYIRMKYTVAGTTAPTQGKIFAAIVDAIPHSYHNEE